MNADTGAPQLAGYEGFFGLAEPPFSLAADPRFLFASASHSKALADLTYALQRREPVVVLTGAIGTGKTLLCRTVLQRLERRTFLSVIGDPMLGRDDLLKQLLHDFGVITSADPSATAASRHDLAQALEAFLHSLAAIQAHAVVVIDEAQHLQPEVLEQIRLLSNTSDARGTLLQIVLVGQSGLEPLLERADLRQLQQRVTRRLTLKPLTRSEVERYIDHRLATARAGHVPSIAPGAADLARELSQWSGGGHGPGVAFTPDAIEAIADLSGGLPRAINVLCDRALEQAAAMRVREIDAAAIRAAARDAGVRPHDDDPAASPAAAGALSEARPEPDYTLATEAGGPAASSLTAGTDVAATASDRRSRTPPVVVGVAAVIAVAAIGAAALWYTSQRTQRSAPAAPPARPAPSSAARPQPAASAPAPATTAPTAGYSTPTPAATTVTPPRPTAAPTSGATPPPPSVARGFDVVVAAFRTELRADAVSSDISALGLPVHRRSSPDWQQVLCGPFATREEAEEAQERLARRGFSGTQIVVAAR